MALPLLFVISSGPWAAVTHRPSQVHLALTGDVSEMRVMWHSNVSATAPAVAEWSPSAGALAGGNATRSTGSSHTYGIGDMCGAPANDTSHWVDPGTIADAVMRGLPVGRVVYYRVGDGTGDACELD